MFVGFIFMERKTNEEIKSEIEDERLKETQEIERKKLNKELFNLKNRKVLGLFKTIGSGFRQVGSSIATKGEALAKRMEENNSKQPKSKMPEVKAQNMLEPTEDWGFKDSVYIG